VTPPATIDRPTAADEVATALLPAASLATRLLLRQTRAHVARSEASVLAALDAGPERITTLAAREGLAQPTMTLMVKRIEERGWVTRERDPHDGRVVLVSLTDDGRRALEEVRADYRGALRGHMAAMTDEEIADLVTATHALQRLVEALQNGEAR
jgi:DNA-binding MarR family transcriptional regulator